MSGLSVIGIAVKAKIRHNRKIQAVPKKGSTTTVVIAAVVRMMTAYSRTHPCHDNRRHSKIVAGNRD